MLFHTSQFFLFLAGVLLLFYTAPRAWRRVILLIASYYFYMSWNPKFIPLLLGLTAVDYVAGIWIARSSEQRHRRYALYCSLAANLGFLAFFKFFNFITDNVVLLLRMPPRSLALDIVLPLGISFHTFQSISYVVDVYRGEQDVIRNPIDYALFISFFPQLVAGPIVRAREFFKDLYHWQPPNGLLVQRGVLLFTLGLLKKVCLADHFALVSNSYFSSPLANLGALTAWSGVFAFAMQIYFDFSGYTDMAIGLAALFGFQFPVNFRRPYLAPSVTEFWHRWHMTLSRWLRDYLYIPLGGNRHGRLKTYRNLMLTMLLGGLWHGASWNFVIWGGYHGALLSGERMLGRSAKGERRIGYLYPLQALATFALVLIGWVFFRAATFQTAVDVLGQMFSRSPGVILGEGWVLCMAGGALLLALLEEHLCWSEWLLSVPPIVYSFALAFLWLVIELLGVVDRSIPFVYFQF
jgi:alginate O-acetyltransferase complex protein AlgI